MKQLNIEFFWPLTEQIPLELDYSECKPHPSTSIVGLHGPFNTGMIRLNNSNATFSTVLNGWDIGKKEEPTWLRKMLMKYLIVWKWSG